MATVASEEAALPTSTMSSGQKVLYAGVLYRLRTDTRATTAFTAVRDTLAAEPATQAKLRQVDKLSTFAALTGL